MAHSIEARVPFLDHRLVEFAFRLPGGYKVKDTTTKDVLRRAMKDILPERVRTRRDKIGFRAEPTATWAIADRHRDALIANRTPFEQEWLDTAAVEAALSSADRSAAAEFLAWRVINLKLWLRGIWADSRDAALL
jgi:asparagine synthase (glutamine-hydrolysing)